MIEAALALLAKRVGVEVARWLLPKLIAAAVALMLCFGVVGVAGYASIASMFDDQDDDQATASACVTINPSPQGAQKTVADLRQGWEPYAATILSVTASRGLPARAGVIALATAMQESRLANLDNGDRDSLGLFQQRPSQGWGTRAQVTDPAYATGKFLDSLVKVPDWQTKPVTVAAQAVQRSGFPLAYADWETLAASIAAGAPAATGDPLQVAGAQQAVSACADIEQVGFTDSGVAATGAAKTAIDAAHRWLGTPYSWGGGGPSGPGRGFSQGAGTVGFDCSSLTQYAYAQAGLTLPRTTRAQYAAATAGGYAIGKTGLQPGDLLYFANTPSNPATIYHVGIWIGGGQMLHAPKTGDVVKVSPIDLTTGYWSRVFIGATRPSAMEGAPTT